MNQIKSYRFIVLILLFTFTLGTSVYAYNDLGANHWAYKAVSVMQERGILHGYPDGNFYPENNVTREEFAKIVVNTLELTKKGSNLKYEDIEEDRWSKEYIDIGGKYFTAYKQGDKYLFKPEEASVREDVIVTTVLALKMEDEKYNLDILNEFSDRNKITPSLEKYIAIAVKNDLIHGNPDGTLNPKGNLTRAEVSQFMYNILIGLDMEEEEEEIVKIPVVEELDNERVDFYAFVGNIERENEREYCIELENIDGNNVFLFERTEGENLYINAENLAGTFGIVAFNKNERIKSLTDLDGNKFMVNYDDLGKEISMKLTGGDNKYFEVKSMNNVRFNKGEKTLSDKNQNKVALGSSVVVVKLMLDDKGTTRKLDDEYKVEFAKGYEELKSLDDDYVIVVKDLEKRTNNTKYVIVFEESEDLTCGILTATKFNGIELLISINDEKFIEVDEDDTEIDIFYMIMDNNLPVSGEKISIVKYCNKDDEKVIVKDVMLKNEFNLGADNYLYVLEHDNLEESVILTTPQKEEKTLYLNEYEDYKFFVIEINIDIEDETEMQYLPEMIDEYSLDDIRLKEADRIDIDEENKMFIILRGFPERK